jgi:hypothetical protein
LSVVYREPIFDFHVERGVVFLRARFRISEKVPDKCMRTDRL